MSPGGPVPAPGGRGPSVSNAEALRAWVRVALNSFGGPAGQIAVVHRIVVEEKRWLSEERFLHALSYCMLLPGPEAQQLATYVGWLLHGVRGGLVAGCLFIAPGFLSILALSLLYVGFRETPVVAGLFYGVKPAVIAVVISAVLRLARRALTGPAAVAVAGGALVAILAFGVSFPLVVLAAALTGFLLDRGRATGGVLGSSDADADDERPSLTSVIGTAALWSAIWLTPLALLWIWLGPGHVFVQEGLFFSKAAVVTFGGAYSVLTYVAQQAVETFRWLEPGQMLDGLGMAETTPGPLIQVVQFVGFMGAYDSPGSLSPVVSAVIGSIVTTWVTFAPCFLFIFAGAPFIESLRRNRPISAALRGITAAVVGVVLHLAIWFGLHTLFGQVRSVGLGPASILVPVPSTLDWRSSSIALGACFALFRLGAGMTLTLAGGALMGIVLFLLGGGPTP